MSVIEEVGGIVALEKLQNAELKHKARVRHAGALALERFQGRGPLSLLMDRLQLSPAELAEFYRTQDNLAREFVQEMAVALQTTPAEIDALGKREVLEPTRYPHLSYHTSSHAYKPDSNLITATTNTADASGHTLFALGANQIHAEAQAFGAKLEVLNDAVLTSWFYFDLAPFDTAGIVHVYVPVELHGTYMVKRGAGSAAVRLNVRTDLYHNGILIGGATNNVIYVADGAYGRVDDMSYLNADTQPLGAGDAIQVKVTLELGVSAKGAGAAAAMDFGFGPNGLFQKGNFVNVPYVSGIFTKL
jgi:hypothetical protein